MALCIKILLLKEKLEKLLHYNTNRAGVFLGRGFVVCLFASFGLKLIVFFHLW